MLPAPAAASWRNMLLAFALSSLSLSLSKHSGALCLSRLFRCFRFRAASLCLSHSLSLSLAYTLSLAHSLSTLLLANVSQVMCRYLWVNMELCHRVSGSACASVAVAVTVTDTVAVSVAASACVAASLPRCAIAAH